ncbi:hypothetical protein RRG08_000699 [Elysia crispata]|uniref:Secreted protein n=1 Tax=Elysia crispata TaxID=231223 RepID=A0AAE1AP26_9GAST|nr:hypothetical protein RRG08_000699 [Elysia crispata]
MWGLILCSCMFRFETSLCQAVTSSQHVPDALSSRHFYRIRHQRFHKIASYSLPGEGCCQAVQQTFDHTTRIFFMADGQLQQESPDQSNRLTVNSDTSPPIVAGSDPRQLFPRRAATGNEMGL